MNAAGDVEGQPRLATDAPIVPVPDGWLVATPSETARIRRPAPPDDTDRFLDLLDGTRTPDQIADAAGLQIDDVTSILRELRALDLLTAPSMTGSSAGGGEPRPEVRRAPGLSGLPPVLLVGPGPLGSAILARLGDDTDVRVLDPAAVDPATVGDLASRNDILKAMGEAAAEAGLVFCCVDRPSDLGSKTSELCRRLGVPLVLVDGSGPHGLVATQLASANGRARGCARCTILYRDAATEFSSALAEHVRARFPLPARWAAELPAGALETLASFGVLAASRAVGDGDDGDQADARVVRVDWEGGKAEQQPARPHPDCIGCYPAGVMSREHGSERITRWWSEGMRRDGGLALEALRNALGDLVATRHGLLTLRDSMSDHEARLRADFYHDRGVNPRIDPLANAHMCTVTRHAWDGLRWGALLGVGADFEDRRRAEALAIVEALERLFTLHQCDPRLVTAARYDEVADTALDPRELPLYAPEQYDQEDFPLRPFRPDAEIDWIWGIRVGDGTPVLAPHDVVYAAADSTLYYPSSNGAACHTSLPEAILNGIYETIERDALMVTWLGRLSMPRVELGSEDPDPHSVRATLESLSFELKHLDLTTDLGVPVTLATLRDRRSPGFFLVDMAASLSPEDRLRKLNRELAQFVRPYFVDPEVFTTSATTGEDPASVRNFRDHAAFYQDPEKHRLFDFLEAATETRTARSELDARPGTAKEELEQVVALLGSRGYEVIAVDCTHRFLAERGLYAVKVLIPGLQPVSPSYRFRVLGGRRIYELPQRLGLRDHTLTYDDLNPWPHPFW